MSSSKKNDALDKLRPNDAYVGSGHLTIILIVCKHEKMKKNTQNSETNISFLNLEI